MQKQIAITVAVIVFTVLLRVYIGVSFGLAIGLIVFFGVCSWLRALAQASINAKEKADQDGVTSEYTFGRDLKKLASIGRILAIVFLVGSMAISIFHRTSKGFSEVSIAALDQFGEDLSGDRTSVHAKDIWRIHQERASGEFLVYYNRLLAIGFTKEAADTLKGFNQHWDIDLLKDQKDQTVGAPSVQIAQAVIPDRDFVIRPSGEYKLNLQTGEENQFWDSIPSGRSYRFADETKVQLSYPDGTTATSGTIEKWPGKYKFKIKNLGSTPPKLIVQ